MNTTAGLWIDHRKAVVAIVSAKGEETMEIKSNVDKTAGQIRGHSFDCSLRITAGQGRR